MAAMAATAMAAAAITTAATAAATTSYLPVRLGQLRLLARLLRLVGWDDYPYSYGYGYYHGSPATTSADARPAPSTSTSPRAAPRSSSTARTWARWTPSTAGRGYLWLPQGTYDVAFYLDGYKTVARQITVYPGTVIDIDDRLEPGDRSVPRTSPPRRTERRDDRMRYERERRERIDRGERGMTTTRTGATASAATVAA